MAVFIWALFKNASQPWCLRTAEDALARNGLVVLDGARGGNVHVMGQKRGTDLVATVVCTRHGQAPTSVVVHAFSADEAAARSVAAGVRDVINRAHSLEGDTVQNPV